MTQVLLTTLFAAILVLVTAAMRATWRAYGRQALALRDQLRACPAVIEARLTVRETRRLDLGNVVMLPVRRRVTGRNADRPAAAGLRAAA